MPQTMSREKNDVYLILSMMPGPDTIFHNTHDTIPQIF